MISKKPIFIISFDCEGKWGVADHLSKHHRINITSENISYAYEKILVLLQKYQLVATFAFVGLFSLSQNEYVKYLNAEVFPIAQQKWMRAFFDDEKRKDFDGWFGSDVFEAAKNAGHEMASHGFTHIPLSDVFVDLTAAKFELDGIKKIAKTKNMNFETFIYPRNAIEYSNILKEYGFIGYRDGMRQNLTGIFAKLCNFIREFNILQKAQKISANNTDMLAIPSGYMLTWRSGFKEYIPLKVILMRWRSVLRDAVKNNGVVHLWAHPCNFIDGKDQVTLFEEILKIVVTYINDGKMINLTQEQYCKTILDIMRIKN